MLRKTARLFNVKFIHFSVLASIYAASPVHAGHLQKILPQSQVKKIYRHYDRETAERFDAWNQLLKSSHDKSDIEKLELVNNFFNQMKWAEDKQLWESKDYWATPIESLIKNAGDCEDFSIAKYFTLLELGIPVENLKVSYVKLIEDNQAHMVLAYYAEENSDPLILDNIHKEIRRGSERNDLDPMFHFNSQGVWKKGESEKLLDSAIEIKQWAEMMKRINLEQNT